MALRDTILQKGLEIYNKVQNGDLNLKYGMYRDGDGMLDLDSSTMDCSMFVLKATKAASSQLFEKLTTKSPSGKYGGNTSTIKQGILSIEGIASISNLRQTDPEKGDWIIWDGHVEIVCEVTDAGGYLLLGANGANGGVVPKQVPCRNMTKLIGFAGNFKGIWTPKYNSLLEETSIKI